MSDFKPRKGVGTRGVNRIIAQYKSDLRVSGGGVAALRLGAAGQLAAALPSGRLPEVANLAYLFTLDSDQTTDTTATDASANARSMTLVNTPTQVSAAPLPGFRRYFSEDTRDNQYGELFSVRPSVSGITQPEDPALVTVGSSSPRTWTATVNCKSDALYGWVITGAYRSLSGHPAPCGYYIYIDFKNTSPTVQMRLSQNDDDPSQRHDLSWPLPNGADDLDHTIVVVKHPELGSSWVEVYWDGVSLGRTSLTLASTSRGFEFFTTPVMCISAVLPSDGADGLLGQDLTLWTTEFTADQAAFVHTIFQAKTRMKKYLGL